jgi:hypothetical protein
MKQIISIILLLSSLSLSAQRVAYCQLLASNLWGGRNVYITLDLGEHGFGSIIDTSGKAKKFHGTIDALNHMASLGWKVKEQYILTIRSKQVQHFLLEKAITDTTQILEGIYIKQRDRSLIERPKPGASGDDIY